MRLKYALRTIPEEKKTQKKGEKKETKGKKEKEKRR